MIELEPLFDELKKAQPGAELDLIERAYRFSEARHRGQQRASGEPYLSHPLEVARLLASFKMDRSRSRRASQDVRGTRPPADLERYFGREETSGRRLTKRQARVSSREDRQARTSGRCSSQWRATARAFDQLATPQKSARSTTPTDKGGRSRRRRSTSTPRWRTGSAWRR